MKIWLQNIPQELKEPLKEMEALLPLTIEEGAMPVQVIPNHSGPKITVENGAVTIGYHKIPEFFRVLTLLPSRIAENGVYEEQAAYEDLCLMADCSRNAVMNLAAAKRMIRYLALMGFTSFMLYTEDTYEMPEYPMFGYLRGRFSKEELKEIDRYALLFGIEVIPCIQTLAHLPGSLRYYTFDEVIDVNDILLVGEEKTYRLIDCMIRTCRECFSSKRIHVGMDEAHLLGSGKYLDINGYRPRSEIILEHLDRVVKLCENYQFHPMIWSDMFFRIAFHRYYVEQGEIPAEIIEMVPKNLTLVYWDYYSAPHQTGRFEHMLHCHQQFHNPIAFAGGAWKWGGVAPSNFLSLWVNEMQLAQCRARKIPMVIATAWGDNGAECSHFSIMATLQQYAEFNYAKGEDRSWVQQRFFETFGLSFDHYLLLDSPNLLSDINPTDHPHNAAKFLLYNDPIGGMMDAYISDCYTGEYTVKIQTLEEVPANQFDDLFKTSLTLCRVLQLKATLSIDIRKAYQEKNTAACIQIARERIPALLSALEDYHSAFRAQWKHENKAYGLDVIDLRLGGLKERLRTAARTLEEYACGKIDCIEQLEEAVLPSVHSRWGSISTMWNRIASGNII